MTDGAYTPRSKTPWVIAAVLIVVGGFVAALVSGGGTGQVTTDNGRAGSAGGTATAAVTSVRAAPPSNGETVVAAKQLSVGAIVYRTVLSTPGKPGPSKAIVPLYMTLYVGQPSPLSKLDRIRVPFPFARDSYVSQFRPSANSDKTTASALLSWFLHPADKTIQTHYFELTPHGIQVDS